MHLYAVKKLSCTTGTKITSSKGDWRYIHNISFATYNMFLRHVTVHMRVACVYLCAILLINWRVKRRESLEPNYRTANSQQGEKK